ncbi:(d)CMP kinase [Candidatus Contubernalis alkaliaceticus]|uniref:(d)CMP kinase n=1 Tax=Candidatus Contubernalis alkaliaceticus TaxID=338645 RepID=UPI001F4BFEF7|nr:(d)CMP kinase [Candidatus Contubernalis alkalaceticus]
MVHVNIAIDGPAGAGKSTAAKGVAKRLGLKYIDTGAMYRAITWKGILKGIDFEKSREIELLTSNTVINIKKGSDDSNRIYLDGVDVTTEIRDPSVNRKVSLVAKNQQVRDMMVAQQREIASGGGIVMDGRDIGTHVLPGAHFKFFINATLEERAHRRYLELTKQGHEISEEDVQKEISMRDKIDTEREFSPLVAAKDAIFVDTTNLTAREVEEKIVIHVKECIQAGTA